MSGITIDRHLNDRRSDVFMGWIRHDHGRTNTRAGLKPQTNIGYRGIPSVPQSGFVRSSVVHGKIGRGRQRYRGNIIIIDLVVDDSADASYLRTVSISISSSSSILMRIRNGTAIDENGCQMILSCESAYRRTNHTEYGRVGSIIRRIGTTTRTGIDDQHHRLVLRQQSFFVSFMLMLE